jgi:hypothetical protein
MWPGAKDELSLWNVESGKRKDGFDLPNQNPKGIEISLALDSSTTLLARVSGFTIYATRGNVIVEHYDTKGRTRILGSYLAQGYVILNTKPLISDDRLCTLKVLNYHDNMAEEFALATYQDYKILCLPRCKDLIMGYHRGSILNVIQHENIIPTEPREHDDHSCNLQTIQLSDIPLDSVHQQVLDAGPTIELAYAPHLTGTGYANILRASVIFSQEPRKCSTIVLGPNTPARNFSLIQDPPQLLLFTLDGIQVWTLPLTKSDNFELTASLVFTFSDGDERHFHTWIVTGAKACMACRKLDVDYIPYTEDLQEKPPRCTKDFFDGKSTIRMTLAITNILKVESIRVNENCLSFFKLITICTFYLF